MSSTEAEAAPESAASASEPEADPSAYFPGHIRKLSGFSEGLGKIEDARKEERLPSLNPTDYRFVLKPPGGIPYSFPVQVVYKQGTPQEKDLGTFRIGR